MVKNPQWGAWFKVKRQLDASELGRYENYCIWCREVIDCLPASEEVWRVVNQGIKTV